MRERERERENPKGKTVNKHIHILYLIKTPSMCVVVLILFSEILTQSRNKKKDLSAVAVLYVIKYIFFDIKGK